MESVIRAAAAYLFLLLILRLSGKRALAQITTFDFVLLLIISEATQNALVGDNYSLTNSFLVIMTLVTIDLLFSFWKLRFPSVDRVLEGTPLVIVQDGKPLQERMAKSRVDESDVLHAARELQGLERIDQIKYAVLERNGGITVIPKS